MCSEVGVHVHTRTLSYERKDKVTRGARSILYGIKNIHNHKVGTQPSFCM